jgi:hypothetical protein
MAVRGSYLWTTLKSRAARADEATMSGLKTIAIISVAAHAVAAAAFLWRPAR